MREFPSLLVATSIFAATLFALSANARADEPGEFSLSMGYARINFDGESDLIDDRDAFHLDTALTFAPFTGVPQLRLGGGVGLSVALDDVRGAVISRDGELIAVSGSDATLWFVEPELRLSWRQDFGRDGEFFVEPGAAAGAAFAWIDIGDEDDDGAFSESDVSFEWRVFLRAGMRVTGGIAGIEASYLQTGDLEFTDDLGGEASELYVGIFGTLQF